MADDFLAFAPHRSVVDGVPVYSTSVPTATPSIALTFRVGVVDEPFGQRGITHLVEHLALHDVRGAPYAFNVGASSGTAAL